MHSCLEFDRKLVLVATLCSVAMLFCGCSDDKPKLVNVTGTVTQNGQPVTNAQVEFYPQSAGATSYGQTDENGKFTLRYSTGEDGAAIGMHSVVVIGGRVEGGAVQRPAELPESTEDAEEGTLDPVGEPDDEPESEGSGGPKEAKGIQAEVVDGPNDIKIEI